MKLLADVLNRRESLPTSRYCWMSRAIPTTPNKDEAKDLLELYLGEDYGTDWNSWGQHMTNWMQQNPD